MKDSKPTSTVNLSEKLQQLLRSFLRYSVIFFLVLVLATYSFIAFRIYQSGNVTPTDEAVNSQLHDATTPQIDPKVVQQIQGLQDRSVNVKTLFDQARSNPFGE